jgi:hypothetical protein
MPIAAIGLPSPIIFAAEVMAMYKSSVIANSSLLKEVKIVKEGK